MGGGFSIWSLLLGFLIIECGFKHQWGCRCGEREARRLEREITWGRPRTYINLGSVARARA